MRSDALTATKAFAFTIICRTMSFKLQFLAEEIEDEIIEQTFEKRRSGAAIWEKTLGWALRGSLGGLESTWDELGWEQPGSSQAIS